MTKNSKKISASSRKIVLMELISLATLENIEAVEAKYEKFKDQHSPDPKLERLLDQKRVEIEYLTEDLPDDDHFEKAEMVASPMSCERLRM
jgi:hypothetical protein